MKPINIEMDVDTYKNTHLMLHNLIELTSAISNGEPRSAQQYKEMFQFINDVLKTLKTTLEVK